MGQTDKKWCGSGESIILYKHPSICVILLADSNKKTDKFIFLFDESFFLILGSCLWRKLYCILLFCGNYWIIQLLVELFLDNLPSFDSLWRRDWWYIFATNLRIYIFWWDLFFSSSINISHSVWIVYESSFSLNIFFFFLRLSYISIRFLFFEHWIFSHLPFCFQVSNRVFFGCFESWLLWVCLSMWCVMGNTLREEQLKEHFLGKLFSLSQNLLSISPKILMRNRTREKKAEYLNNEPWTYYKIKNFLNCTSKGKFSGKLSVFSRGTLPYLNVGGI